MLWSSRLFWRLLAIVLLVDVALVGGFVVLASWSVRPALANQATVDAQRTLRALAVRWSNVETVDPAELAALGESLGMELAVCDSSGKRLAATLPVGEARLDWPEVAVAREKGTGAFESRTARFGPSSHVAVRVPGDRLGRIACGTISLADVDRRVAVLRLWALAAGAALALVSGLALWLAIAINVGPLAKLTEGAQALAEDGSTDPLEFQSGSARHDELGTIDRALSRMQSRLASRVDQLRQNSDRLAAVLENMAEGVLAVDASERVLFANESSRAQLGMTAAELIGRPLLEVTRSLAVQGAVVEALRSTGPVRREFESLGPERRTLSLRATKLPGDPSPGALVVLHDVTELRRLENLRREFVANVSHELKTPLAAVKGYAETLRLGAINDPANNLAFVLRIEDEAERLHQLILDLLQIARVESGQEALEIVDVDLGAVIHNCLGSFQAKAAAKEIRLSCEGTEEEILARADEEGVMTILGNLVDNAIKYSSRGGSVVVSCRRDNAAAVLEVQDTGIGIAPADQVRVFERFFRVDKARSREVGGTGLGLSIVKNLANAFGGTVGLESQPNRGSKFAVRLPLSSTTPTETIGSDAT